MKIKIRQFKEEDTSFILDAWIKSSYGNITGYREKYSVYHKGMEQIIKKQYENGLLVPMVACLDDDEDFILGFAVFGTDYTLHYAFTKEAFKRLGVCKSILKEFYKNRDQITVSFWCKDIAYIKKVYSVNYNRFKLLGVRNAD